MKNKRQKLMAMLVASVFAVNAWAQTDVTPYFDDGDYLIINTETGCYLGGGNDWGTHATLLGKPQFFTFAHQGDNAYTLDSHQSNGGNNHFLATGLYCDGAAANWIFAKNENGNYTINNGGNYLAGNGANKVIVTVIEVSAAAEWTIISKSEAFAALDNATVENPVDATIYISNPECKRNAGGWTITGADGTGSPSHHAMGSSGNTANCSESYHSTNGFDMSQVLVGMKPGVYRLDAHAFYRNDNDNTGAFPYIYVNDQQSFFPERTGSENSMAAAYASFLNGDYAIEPIYFTVAEGDEVKIGAHGENTLFWNIWGEYGLTYYGDVILNEVLLADVIKAYNTAFDVATSYQSKEMFDEDNAILAQSITENTLDLSTATEEQLAAATTNLEAAAEVAAAAVKGYASYNTATQLIAADSESAEVDLTSLLVNPGFEQGNVEGWTNSGVQSASAQGNKAFDNTQGNYYAEKWHANGTIDLNQTIKYLPAGIYKLSAYVYSDTQDAKLYANDKETSFSTSGLYSVLVEIDDKGAIKFGASCTLTSSTWICMDGFTLSYVNYFTYALAEGKMSVAAAEAQTAADAAYQANKTFANYEALLAAISDAEQSKAAYENLNAAISKAEEIIASTNVYAEADKTAYQTAIDDAKAAYADGSFDGNATMINKLWNTQHQSADLLARPFISSVWSDDNTVYTNNWSTEANNKTNGSGMITPFVEYWVTDANSLGEKTIDAVVSDLEVGAYYEVSALVRVRIKDGATEATGITMDVNGASVNVCDGATCDDGTAFRYGTYKAIGKVGEDGNLTITFSVAAENTLSWLSFKNVNYTKVDFMPADAADYEALNSAISAAGANTLGFLQGEYAPYNNVEALVALAAAKAVDQNAQNAKDDVQAITATLNAATWTANTEEMNAIYDGSFAIQEENTTSPITVKGWNVGDGLRQLIKNVESYPGLNDASSQAAIYVWNGTYSYGNVDGYTMPLKANTVYELSFLHAGWTGANNTFNVSVLNEDEEGLAVTNVGGASKGINSENSLTKATVKFTTGAAGNYVLKMNPSGNAVFTDIKLYSVPESSVTMTVKEDCKYATFIAPFDVELPTGVTASKITGVEENGYTLTEEAVEGTIPANTPVVLYSEAPVSETFTGYSLATQDSYTVGLLTGTHVDYQTVANTDTYVLQNHDGAEAFYYVGESAQPWVRAGHCYLVVAAAEGAPMFSFDRGEGTTSIDNAQLTNDNEVVIYDLAGRRVQKMEKGIYIVGGRKVIK